MFENLVNYDKSKTHTKKSRTAIGFENLVNYDKSKTIFLMCGAIFLFENLVNYDKSKTKIGVKQNTVGLRTL